MKHIHYLIIISLSLLGLWACSDDFAEQNAGGCIDGKVCIELTRSSATQVVSRAENQPETVENVAVFVFRQDGTKSNGFTMSSTENIKYIDVYLNVKQNAQSKENDASIYVVANYPNPDALINEVNTLVDLKKRELTIETAEGAYPGKYVMTGFVTVDELKQQPKRHITISRLAAHLTFNISVNTNPNPTNSDGTPHDLVGDGGEFKLSAVYLCQVPKGSYLYERTEGNEIDEVGNILNSKNNDWAYKANAEEMRKNYFSPIRLAVREEADGSIRAEYDMFENRRGRINENLTDAEGNLVECWPELIALKEHDLYTSFKQMYKRTRAMDYPEHIGKISIKHNTKNEALEALTEVKEAQFYNATYLRIDGIYKEANGRSFETSYYVYLGSDNHKDYNVKRNYWYTHNIVIRSYDSYDHRVYGNGLDKLTIQAPDDELDAHYNVVKVLMYAIEDWSVTVENPDETPWLEVSHSSIYKPRVLGKEPDGKEAAFTISGAAGLNYFYIHTDEYVPNITREEENIHQKPRMGKVVCRSGNDVTKINVKQLPAQLVMLDIGYDILAGKHVSYPFFIEKKLEQKYMPWGFYHYWSWITDLRITQGAWDGLGNTKILHHVGLIGDYNEILHDKVDPAYPKGLPYDHAIGYITMKNRDCNGNGKIDEDEIKWYWPATKELKAIYDAKRNGWVDFEGKNEVFHASTPSSADPVGITPGFSYNVKMSNGKSYIERRDRKYNVISCRRLDAEKPSAGIGNGSVTTDPNWSEGDEVIIPRGK